MSPTRSLVARWGATALFLLVLFGISSLAAAQETKLVGLTVEGQTVTDPELIKNVSGLKIGETIAQEQIQQALHRIYGLHLFEDVRLLGEESTDGVRLIIRVKEFARLSLIQFEGNKKLEEDDFGLEWRRGQTIGPNRLRAAEETIRRIYQKKGFFLVKVEGELVSTGVTGETNVLFRIEENRPVKVSEVVFIGNAHVVSGDLRGGMSNKPRGFLKSLFGGGKFDREKYADDHQIIIDTYRSRGFLDAAIISDTIILHDDLAHVTLQIEISEGPRYYFGTSEFSGNELFDANRLVRLLKYHEGDIFDQQRFEESVGRMYEAYMEEGYLYTRVIDETQTTDSVVSITYEISEGVPAHVHRIDIVGNGKTRDKVIRRELTIYPGQVFRRSSLQRSIRNVMLLNYFGNVVPDFQQLPDGRVNLQFKVEEKPTGQIQVGGGYSEQDRFVGTVDLGIPNLFGRGQRANLLVEFGSRRQSYRLGFTEPWFMDTPTTVGFDLQQLDRVWDYVSVPGNNDFTQRTTGITLRLGRRLRWPDDYFSIFTNYRWEDLQYNDFSREFLASPFSAGLIPGIISSTSFTVMRDSRNLPEFATDGSRASYRVELGGGVLGGDWTYTQHNFSYSFFKKIWKGLTFAPKWSIGIIEGASGGNVIPSTELFLAGGIRSDGMIRGYNDRSIIAVKDTGNVADPLATISPQLITDKVTGRPPVYSSADSLLGQGMIVMNAQITFPIVQQQIHGIFFFDAGNVWHDITDAEPFSDMYTSYGFGFRIAVPGMGTLGFDFGIPLRGLGKGKVKPHFQFGGAF